jgi:hypothetical protein
MNAADILAMVALALAIGGIVYNEGRRRQEQASFKRDLTGIGKKLGRIIALLILWADTPEKREQLSKATEPP